MGKATGSVPRSRHRQITRERVLDAAEKLFLEKGLRATSVHEIAASAGYTTGAIYSSFTGKDDLFLAVFRRRLHRQEVIWRETLESVTNSADAAAAMGAALTLATPEPAWFAVLFEFLSHAARDERLSHETADLYRASPPLLADILREVSSSSPLPLDRLAPIIVGLMRGLSLTWFVDPEAADASLFSDGVAVLIGAVPVERPHSDGKRL